MLSISFKVFFSAFHKTDAQRFCGLLSVAMNQHQAKTNIEKTLN
jgi:hypothetical protein